MSTAPKGDPAAIAPSYFQPDPASGWAHAEGWGGVLPHAQPLVTLANWQQPPHLTWSFQHMRELMPSQVIYGTDTPRPLTEDLQDIGFVPLEGVPYAGSVDEAIAASETDGILVIKDGSVVLEQYFGPMVRRSRHLVMSVSKSIVSTVAASLSADGLLDVDAGVETYVPELQDSGYAGATVRNLLDMRTGVRFHETYLDPESEVRVMERSVGWAPRNQSDPLGMYPYILSTARETEHGGVFTYRSLDTDALGWIVERATQRRMADLVSERLWQPIGAFHDAEVTVDPLGSAIHDGGVSATLRDLGRFGLMLLDRGMVSGRQVVPAEWIETASYPPADVRDAFARSENEAYLPGGWYRNQFWFVPGDTGPVLLCLGIHGQMVFVEESTRTVGVKLSSWPTAQHAEKLVGAISMFRQIARHLS